MYTVRKARREDIPALLDLLVQVDMVHHNGRPDLFKGPTTKYSEAELEELLAEENENKPVFVCADESRKIVGHGFCEIQIPENTRLMVPCRTLYVDDICVDENARGNHAGRALYEHIEQYAKEAGCARLTLNVWTCNPGAMRFYEKMGLEPYRVSLEKVL